MICNSDNSLRRSRLPLASFGLCSVLSRAVSGSDLRSAKPARQPKVRVVFWDREGRAWEIFDYVLIAGVVTYRDVGGGNADSREFRCVKSGDYRLYAFAFDSPHGGRGVSAGVLQRQLDQAGTLFSADRDERKRPQRAG